MNKRRETAFGKKVYLLGKDHEGILYWLEESQWECDWYWGMGYVETYTNNKYPHLSRDINSHQHFDGLFFNGRVDGHTAWNNFFAESVLSSKELWTLMELMKTAYTLQETAAVLGRGGSHYTANPCADVKRINEVVLPAIFEQVYEFLSPEGGLK